MYAKSFLDIDECARHLHDCLDGEECINEVGGFACYLPAFSNEDEDFDKKCPIGYKYNFEKLVCDGKFKLKGTACELISITVLCLRYR